MPIGHCSTTVVLKSMLNADNLAGLNSVGLLATKLPLAGRIAAVIVPEVLVVLSLPALIELAMRAGICVLLN